MRVLLLTTNVWSTELTVMHVDAIIFSVSRARINKQAIVYFPRLHPTVNHNSGTTKTTVRERLSEHARCPIRTWFQMTCHDYNSRTIQAASNFQFKHCSSKCLSVKTKTPDRYIMWLLNLNNSNFCTEDGELVGLNASLCVKCLCWAQVVLLGKKIVRPLNRKGKEEEREGERVNHRKWARIYVRTYRYTAEEKNCGWITRGENFMESRKHSVFILRMHVEWVSHLDHALGVTKTKRMIYQRVKRNNSSVNSIAHMPQ